MKVRIALANIHFPKTPEQSVTLTEQAIADAAEGKAEVVCFPECFVPGYRAPGKGVPPADMKFLERAWARVAEAAAKANVTVILGTERVVNDALLATALVINRDGTVAGFQNKVQLDPPEDKIYSPGSGRQMFQSGPMKFGVVICHEGWRYPETNNGNTLTRRDARNITATFTYDQLNRVTKVRYTNDPQSTPGVDTYYDGYRGNFFTNIPNVKGQAWQTETIGQVRFTVDNFDVMGKPTIQRKQFWSNNAWSNSYQVSVAYDLAGSVIGQTIAGAIAVLIPT